MPRVAVNGIALHYEEMGAGPPLVLIHAFPVGRRMWEAQMTALARRHRVIAYDVRGFGLSDAPREPGAYSQAQSVEDARALIEPWARRRPRCVGSAWAATSRSTWP